MAPDALNGLALAAAALGGAACIGSDGPMDEPAARDDGGGFELGCRVEMVREESGARTLSVLEYDRDARLVRWRGGLGAEGSPERVYAWNRGGSEATWQEPFAPDQVRTTTVSYTGTEGPGARLPVAAAIRYQSGSVAARREYRHVGPQVASDDFISGGITVVTRTYEYDQDERLEHMTAEYFLDEEEGADVVEEIGFGRDELGHVIRKRLFRDGEPIDVIDYQLDEEGLPIRVEHAAGDWTDIGYVGTACAAAVASWRLSWPDPEEP